MTPRVLVVGGGVAGLTAALRLATDSEVVLAESSDHFGGKIATTAFRGRPLDLGPDAFITRDEAATALCRELGLGEELLAPAARGAGVFYRGEVHPLPDGLVIGIPTDLAALPRSGLVSPLGALRAHADRLFPTPLRLSGARDPTVAEALGPRLGREVLEALVDPLIGGINASDVATLSFAAALPQLVPALEGRRSVTRALAALRPAATGPGATAAAAAAPVFFGLEPGLGRLVERLVEAATAQGASLRCAAPVRRLESRATGWSAEIDGTAERFDGVVLALPAPRAADLLEPVAAELAGELGAIPYAGVATVTLAYADGVVPDRLAHALGGTQGLVGNGVLVARSPGRLVTAVTFTSTKWPRSAPTGEIVLRASVGRHRDERPLALDDDALTAAVRADLRLILGIDATPLAVRLQRWPASFPQYVRGHRARVARIESGAAALPHLAITGAALRGIGIPACIRNAERAAAELRAALTA